MTDRQGSVGDEAGPAGSTDLPPFRPTRFQIGAGILVLLTLIAYIPALRGGYVFDDATYLTDNPAIAKASFQASRTLHE